MSKTTNAVINIIDDKVWELRFLISELEGADDHELDEIYGLFNELLDAPLSYLDNISRINELVQESENVSEKDKRGFGEFCERVPFLE